MESGIGKTYPGLANKEEVMKYILNSAVITTPGVYTYRLIDLEEAKRWLYAGDWVNTIGYEETCQALHVLTGLSFSVNRQIIKMIEGDEALVFRLTCRLPDISLKGKLSPEFVLQNCEIGILKKVKELNGNERR